MSSTTPTIAWTRLLGGSSSDDATSLTTGADGAIYVAGETQSSSFDGQTNWDWNVFVIKLASPHSTTGTVNINGTLNINGTAKLGQVQTMAAPAVKSDVSDSVCL